MIAKANQALEDALGKFGSRLASKGEAQNLFRFGYFIGNQPGHANRHERGLATACSGNY